MIKNIFFIALLAGSLSMFAQEKIYYDGLNEESSKENATRYKIVSENHETGKTTEFWYTTDDKLTLTKEYSDYENNIKDGKTEAFSEDGGICSTRFYKNNKLDDNLIVYWEPGSIKRMENYTNGVLINGKCFDKFGNEIIYFPSETKPQYPGGVEKLYKDVAENFRIKGDATGKIIVSFIIDDHGNLTDPKIVQGIDPKMDKQAIHAIKKLPRWTPGTREGFPVNVMYSLPITVSRK